MGRSRCRRHRDPNAEGIDGETPKALRGIGCGEGVPSPQLHREWGLENFEVLFLKMAHFDAFYNALNKI